MDSITKMCKNGPEAIKTPVFYYIGEGGDRGESWTKLEMWAQLLELHIEK